MKPLGMSINALAREANVPPNRISDIVNGKRSITADTALRLDEYFRVSPEIWMGCRPTTTCAMHVRRRSKIKSRAGRA